VGRYVTLHALLAGFFAFGAVQYVAQWCWSRAERVLLLFALHCALGMSLSIALLMLGQATTIAEAQVALGARTTLAIVWVAASVALVSRITGFESRAFARPIIGALLVAAAVNFFIPLNGTVTGLQTADAWWGGTFTIASREPSAWMAAVYVAVAAAFAYGLVGAAHLWRRDRVGAGLAGLAAGGGLIASVVAAFADVGGRTLPYVGDAPSAVWVVLMAMVLSREYADRGERLAAGERRFRAVFDEASEFVFLTLRDGTLTRANRSALTAAGVASEDVVGRPLWETPWWSHDPVVRERVKAALRDAARGAAVKFEATHPRRDGSRSSADCTLAAVRDGRGEVTMLVSESRDVTERVRAHEALLLSGARYRTLIDSAPEAIVVLDVATGRFVDCNQKACEMFGVPVTELRELGVLDISPAVQPDGRESKVAAMAYLGEAVGGGRPVFEWTHRTVAGREFPCEITLVKLPDPDRTLIRGSITDVTERRLLEEQLRQSQKMEAVGRLAGGVAHDFNNLLTVITLSSHLLLEEMESGKPRIALVKDIADAADRASALTRQLLAFGRKAVLAPRVLDINAVVRDAESMLRRLIGEDVQLLVELDAAACLVTIDPGHLSQVLMNLSVNARDAMPVGGTLRIATANLDVTAQHAADRRPEDAQRQVRLTVTDSGTGMPPDVVARIFEPFFTSKGVGKGTGLGLAVVHGIVEQSGGHIEVRSQPGAGTTFAIYLPASDLPADVAAEIARAESRNGHESILLVEDEASLRNLAARALRSRGFRVMLAGDGAEALRLLETFREPLDLLVTDVVMPNMDGRELADRLRARMPGLKVLFLSGYMDDALLRRGVAEANETLLLKPFTPSSLAQRVREVLDFV
jgi:two-component system, cell cycle sensor histidine kinase and response regulator CckA